MSVAIERVSELPLTLTSSEVAYGKRHGSWRCQTSCSWKQVGLLVLRRRCDDPARRCEPARRVLGLWEPGFMPELIVPTVALHQEWLRAHLEWPGEHQDGSGLADDDEVESAAGFSRFVTRLQNEADEAHALPAGRVHCSYWWITEGRVVAGAIALRHELNDFLRDSGGHVGYSVRPSARRRGLAGWALAQALQRASTMGIDQVLATCAVDNEASRRAIEAAGGVLEDVRDTVQGRVQRFWITSGAPGN